MAVYRAATAPPAHLEGTNPMAVATDFSLDAKYTQPAGTILLTGAQALVRLPLDQRRADAARGLNTAGLIAGYRGSPLAGYDTLLLRARPLLDAHQITFIPAINEDLAATAIMGSQTANLYPGPKYDGVFGIWYGKAPGVDRSGDAFKHANFAGVGRYGGVLALAGDDPACKSSTLPSHSEVALYDALMPVIAPGNVQDVLDFGLLGFALSRFSGLWVGVKLHTNVVDEFATAEVAPERIVPVQPAFALNGRPWQPTQQPNLLPPFSGPVEQEIFAGRLAAAEAFAAANPFNRLRVAPRDAWIGLAAAGKPFYELRQALADLGLDDEALERYGVRLLQIGLLFPLEKSIVRRFAAGLDEIVVVEEKRPFLELFIRDALYDRADRPRVIGKRDEQERPFIPPDGELDAGRLAPLIAARLRQRLPAGALRERPPSGLPPTEARRAASRGSARGDEGAAPPAAPLLLARTPYYCSGCPHNTSTLLPEGALGAAGIGCHTMVLQMERTRAQYLGVTQMGGEGAQWVGAAPFTTTPHLFQNLGDGTLAHSGTLAIRQAVVAGAHITYQILYNRAVGMTGGQHADGIMDVPALTRALEAEGVRRIIVTSDRPEQYPPDARWAAGAEVWGRERLQEAQLTLRATPGVTVLIHDQTCAAELRRRRKRGKAADPPTRVFINERICEGCGDCGAKSNCLSVIPVETEFGRKTQIHQSSCNKDYSCLRGDCPAFMTVVPAGGRPQPALPPLPEGDLPEPARRAGPHANVYLIGIGGTGVVTVNQVLGTAALLEGRFVDGLDQTGLSQKGGPVVSHVKIAPVPLDRSNRVGERAADCILAFDLLTAAQPLHLARIAPGRTLAVVSISQAPTGAMIASPDVRFPPVPALVEPIAARTGPDKLQLLDAAALAERYFGDHMAANMIVLGAAYQAGALPVSAAAIERAIALNGVAVAMNTGAFRLGRWAVAAPERVRAGEIERPEALAPQRRIGRRAGQLIESVGASGELRRLLEVRVPDLIAYQNTAYAKRYVAFVRRVRAAEQAAVPGQTRLSEAVARYLYKLMAYKDEYEVARLSLTTGVDAALQATFGPVTEVRYHLHPPLLRALGWNRKIRLGRWFNGVYRLLIAARRLRGTPLDPFGSTHMRRVERALIDEYRAQIEQALAGLSPATYDAAVRLAELPDMIRGYEAVKLRTVQRWREAVRALGFGPPAPAQEATAVTS
jgi:indolepyruvate ferredoxin oxidoreductase